MDWIKMLFFFMTHKPCPYCSADPAGCIDCPACGGEGVVPGDHKEPREVV